MAKTGIVNRILASLLALDVEGITNTHRSSQSNNLSVRGTNGPSSSFGTNSSVTITVDENDSLVVLVGWAAYGTDRAAGATAQCKILDGAVEVVSAVSLGLGQFNVKTVVCFGVITGVSSGSHTYNMQSLLSPSAGSTEQFYSSGVYAAVIKG